MSEYMISSVIERSTKRSFSSPLYREKSNGSPTTIPTRCRVEGIAWPIG